MNSLLLKLNNPMGIKYDPENIPRGCVGYCGGYVKFSHKLFGHIAGMKLMRSYANVGLRSVQDVVYRWVSDRGRDFDSTLHEVCAYCHCRRDTPFEGIVYVSMLYRALVFVESGSILSVQESWNIYDSVFPDVRKGNKPKSVIFKK